MAAVGSVDIQVNLDDAEYRRKKGEFDKDINNYPKAQSIPFDVRPFLSSVRRAKDAVLDFHEDLGKRIQKVSLYVAPVHTLIGTGAAEVLKISDQKQNRGPSPEAIKRERELAQRDPGVQDDLNELARLRLEQNQKDISVSTGRVGQLPSAGVFPAPKPAEAPKIAAVKIEERSDTERLKKRLEIFSDINELDANRALARLSAAYASRNLTQAQYEQESYEISQRASSQRLAIAQQESERIAVELERLGVPVQTKASASPFFKTRQVLTDPAASSTVVQDELAQKLIASENRSAKAIIQIEEFRVKRQNQLRQEQFAYYQAASKGVADVVINGIEGEIGVSNRRLSVLSVTNARLQLIKTAFDEQSSSQRTAIGLMEQYADVALRQAKELQNLSALSKTPVGATPLVRREIVTQIQELTGKSNFADLRLPGLNADQSLLVRRQQQEDAIAQTQAAALDAQLSQKRAGLQLDIQSQAIAQARAEQEARVGLLKAQQNRATARQQVFEAELGIETLPQNASERDRIVARNRLNNAQTQLNLADQGIDLANNGLNAQGVFAKFQQQITQRILQDFGVESKSTRELFNLNNAARERGQSLELATQGIDPTRFNRRSPGINVDDRTPSASASPTAVVFQNQAAVIGIGQLVTLAQQTYLQQRQMLTELQVIATRPSVALVGATPAPSRVLRDNKL